MLKMMIFLIFQGTRFYMNGLISLNGDQARKLKSMNKADTFDSAFVSYALGAIFGDDVLKVSSAGGITHAQLDTNMLQFIHGILFAVAELINTYID